MKFSEMVDQASEFLRQRERVSYRALKREFDLDDELLEDLKAELIDAKRLAATSLARLWQHQGKNAEAHRILSEVYNWFTEGFDTKDLQEAEALLEALSEP